MANTISSLSGASIALMARSSLVESSREDLKQGRAAVDAAASTEIAEKRDAADERLHAAEERHDAAVADAWIGIAVGLAEVGVGACGLAGVFTIGESLATAMGGANMATAGVQKLVSSEGDWAAAKLERKAAEADIRATVAAKQRDDRRDAVQAARDQMRQTLDDMRSSAQQDAQAVAKVWG